MAPQKVIFVAFALFAIVGMASAWSSTDVDTALPPAEDDFEAEAPSPSDNVVGPLGGSSYDAAPVGAPVADNAFPDLSTTQEAASSGTTLGASVVAGVVATVATSFFF